MKRLINIGLYFKLQKKMVSKKVVTILIIVALVLAIGSIVYGSVNKGEKVSTTVPEVTEDTGAGEIGVTVLPPVVEDKNEQG